MENIPQFDGDSDDLLDDDIDLDDYENEDDEYLERSGRETAGLLLIIDELGKFLEFGATNPEQGIDDQVREVAVVGTQAEVEDQSRREDG